VLSGTSLDPSELRYVFKMVKKIQPASDSHVNGASDLSGDYVGDGDNHVMSFDVGDVAHFHVPKVNLDKGRARSQNGMSSPLWNATNTDFWTGLAPSGFRTDTDISGNVAFRERNLQRWEPSADTDVNHSLESTGGATGWDQFSTNEQLFGVKSDYDESIYTTTINRNDPQYAERAARAEILAREIESSSALNAHIREERGLASTDDKDMDEEAK
jgi:PAB1-binding protein PBP1